MRKGWRKITEAEWMSSNDSHDMLDRCRAPLIKYPRKCRLFAVACCKRIWRLINDPRSRSAVEVLERYADGLASERELAAATKAARAAFDTASREKEKVLISPEWAAVLATDPDPWFAASRASTHAFSAVGEAFSVGPERAAQSRLLRCIFGSLPFREPVLNGCRKAFEDEAVIKLAQAIYQEQAFHLLPALGAALQNAGCENTEIITHCNEAGPHVRGCWVVDLVIGQS